MTDEDLMDSVHQWLISQAKIRVKALHESPTLANLARLEEVKARLIVEIRNVQKLIEEEEK